MTQLKLRMTRDRISIGTLFKDSASQKCYRGGVSPFYCKVLNGNGNHKK